MQRSLAKYIKVKGNRAQFEQAFAAVPWECGRKSEGVNWVKLLAESEGELQHDVILEHGPT